MAAREAACYCIEDVSVPPGIALEVTGMGFLPDGRLMISTRRGEVWSADLQKDKWTLFASGLHEPLGLLVTGPNQIVVAQRPELTRITDSDGDGKADRFERLADAWGLSGNFHEWHAGPVRDAAGNFYGALAVGWENGGVSWVPYRGWAYQLKPQTEVGQTGMSASRPTSVFGLNAASEFVPWCCGLRAPGGVGISPDGAIFSTETRGDWFGAPALLHLTRGAFCGHPASLRWEPGYTGTRNPAKLPPEKFASRRKLPAAWFVYDRPGRAPSEPAWDTTSGKFGPFAGQMFVGDQIKSLVMRVVLEKVAGEYQGAVIPFRAGFASGVHRLAWNRDGRLYVGQMARGWTTTGGKPFALQRVTWTGRAPMEIRAVSLTKTGFDMTFTKPVDPATASNPAAYTVQRFHYRYSRSFVSPPVDVEPVPVQTATVSSDGRTVSLKLAPLEPQQIYELRLKGIRSADGEDLLHAEAYYTLNRLRG